MSGQNKMTYLGESESRNQNSVRMTYDPRTGTWVPTTATDDNTNKVTTSAPPIPSSKTSAYPISSGSSANSTQVDSQGAANKEVQEQLLNTLTGDLGVSLSPRTFGMKTDTTIDLKGFGKYLSGLYYVQKITRSLSADSGYTQTVSVLKTGFGDVKPSVSPVEETRPVAIKPSTPAFKVGDKVMIYTDNATYSNAHEGVKVPSWVKELPLTIMQVSKDGTRVLLKEIFSWTYVSNIKYIS